ncbi:biliverdin-producing heme oxygenase [Aurantimonas sp. 22II-16-19i]|uniref:biliverdin-producing heme oxygenase n=1 Tax=Aurantimonas sp. 22II-16-19i TaxID=1317114 RepID=UPI0009F7EE27|nr:biliverdin-producing heme oxygenase [Aurantimonas sp. 22II-16-19i]ORE95028.1 heme oxygenase [Aurantimonas sp. 22II-16-19i]
MSETPVFTTSTIATARQGRIPDELRTYLRAHTAASHARLDSRFEALGANPTLADYQRFILMNLVAYRALSTFLQDPSDDRAALAEAVESNRERLEGDAAAMDLGSPAKTLFTLEPFGAAETIGLAYVLDGSKLGARFIHRRLEKAGLLAHGQGAAQRFLASAFVDDGPLAAVATGPMPAGETKKQRAMQGALVTFGLFERSLDIADRAQERTMPAR